jgi:WD40 repeat protein
VFGVAFHPNGRVLASAGHDGALRFWEVATGRELSGAAKRHAAPVGGVAFSPDGRWVASASDDGGVRLWGLVPMREEPILLGRHDGGASRVAFLPDGRTLASGGRGGRSLPVGRGRSQGVVGARRP